MSHTQNADDSDLTGGDAPSRCDFTSDRLSEVKSWVLSALRGESLATGLLDDHDSDHHSCSIRNGRLRICSRHKQVTRWCVVHGIRHNLAFARSPEITALCAKNASGDNYSDLIRARNARLIMSNKIPELPEDPRHVPYCIWYPDVASQETYRDLARRYPGLAFLAARACAVAGYVSLYRELGVPPDVSVAEEARDSGEKSLEIFADIMASVERYAVMDDYNKKLNLVLPRPGACLNSDAAVRSSLEVRRSLSSIDEPAEYRDLYFDITEDGLIGEEDVGELDPKLEPAQASLLYSPLPADLPSLNKDLLILMAAYEGNVDRYARLKRPVMLKRELSCVIRGIYHVNSFAAWWAGQANAEPSRVGAQDMRTLRMAINARAIMCNDISRVKSEAECPRSELPYLIWYPLRPRHETLRELIKHRPEMRQAVAHACIVADDQSLYESLEGLVPTRPLRAEAQRSKNEFYSRDIIRRVTDLGVRLDDETSKLERQQQGDGVVTRDWEPTTSFLQGRVGATSMGTRGEESIYHGVAQPLACDVDLFMWASEKMRAEAAEDEDGWIYLYDMRP